MIRPPHVRALLRELAGRARHDPHDDLVRLAVRLRARDACEYCLLPTVGQFHIEHVVPTALWDAYAASKLPNLRPRAGRGGPDHLDNLAWSCPFCNAAKGVQVWFRVGNRNVRLFDPRRDRWADHFVFAHHFLFVVGATRVGRATEAALRFNAPAIDGPLGTRHEAVVDGRYPPPWVRERLIALGPLAT